MLIGRRMRRQAVPVTELKTLLQDLPPVNAEEFRAEQDRYFDTEAHFDAWDRDRDTEDAE